MEDAAGVRYQRTGSDAGYAEAGSPVLVRYADDLVALCHSRSRPSRSRRGSPPGWRPGAWPSTRTRRASSPSSEGFDFLGFNVRRYHGKLLIKPSKAAVRRIRERLRAEMRALRGANAQAVIARLNPIIRGSPGDASLLHDVA